MAHNSQNNTANPPSPTSHLRTIYLTTYNLLFAALWTSVFTTTISHLSKPRETLFAATKPLALTNQTASLLEILHAAFGLIKSPLSTTALQTTTRVIQVWMIWHCFPSSTASSHAYTALLLAWSVADSIRYVYLALNMHGRAPGWLAWVRYTMFYPLYPIGIGAEWWLMYRAIEPGRKVSGVIPPLFWFLLALYVPGAYKMYTHMIRQRRKTLGRKKGE